MKKLKAFIKRSMLVLTLLTISISICGCTTDEESNDLEITLEAPIFESNWAEIGTEGTDEESLDDDLTPNITITTIGSANKEEEILEDLKTKQVEDIEAIIYSSISLDLQKAGFQTGTGVAMTLENDNYANYGVYYYSDKIDVFQDSTYRAVGFLEIVRDTEKYYDLSQEESYIIVNDVSNGIEGLSNSSEDDILNICAYNYQNIASYHFIYQDKYVTYYQQSDMRIVYTIEENLKENYNLHLGSLYDYDNKIYIYDESIFGPYNTHSANSLFSEEDYKKLEDELKEISSLQEQNGYKIEEYQVIYISPESIQDYINSEEEDTFFGFSVEQLTSTFGLGTALEYTSQGFKEAQVLKPDDEGGYNWKNFLIKVGIGAGIIIVTAAITAATAASGGAASVFFCSLLSIATTTIKASLITALTKSAVSLGQSLIHGDSLKDSLVNATYSGLDGFASSFMIGSVMAGVGVATGAIKTNACFKRGTPILIDIINGKKIYKNIEDIKIGDAVVSYDEHTREISKQIVSDIFVKQTHEIVRLLIDGEEIITTPNHPFYSPILQDWVSAKSLQAGSYIQDFEGNYKVVDKIEKIHLKEAINVYNFTVERTHTYFVGEKAILVHNKCEIVKKLIDSGKDGKWKEIIEAAKKSWPAIKTSYSVIQEIVENEIKINEEKMDGAKTEIVLTQAKDSISIDENKLIFSSINENKEAYGITYGDDDPDKTVKFLPVIRKEVEKKLLEVTP